MDGAISLAQSLRHYPATRDLPSGLDDSNSVDSFKKMSDFPRLWEDP